MTSEFGYGKAGMFKVVDAEALATETAFGWVCVERFMVKGHVKDQYGNPASVHIDFAGGGTQYGPILGDEPRFLLQLDAECAFAQLSENNKVLSGELEGAKAKIKELEAANAQALEHLKETQECLDLSRDRVKNYREDWEAQKARANRMETDLAELRAKYESLTEAIATARASRAA